MNPNPDRRRRITTLAGLAAMLVACTGADGAEPAPTMVASGTATTVAGSTTTSPPGTTATSHDGTTVANATGMTEGEATALVEELFASYNAGDMETWFLWRESGGAPPPEVDYLLAVRSRFTVERCSYRGVEIWDMDGPNAGHGFDCEVTQSDDLLNAAGIDLEMTYNWVIGGEPETSQGGSNEDFHVATRFMTEYRNWLAANHPDVEAGLEYGVGLGLGADVYPSPDSVPTALEYIDAFVTQADDYPLTEPVPAGDYGGPLSR